MKRIAKFFFLIVIILINNCSNKNGNRTIELSGVIETVEVNISSKVSGEILKILKSEGDAVKKNDTMAVIDKKNLDIQFAQANANLDLLKAQLNLTLNGNREEDITQAKEIYEQAKTNFESAQSDKKRMEPLFNSKSISEKQWEDVQTKFQITKSQLFSVEASYKKIKKGFRKEDIESALARKKQAEAQLELIKKQINDTYITSPVNGIITSKTFEEGESVNPGSIMFTISRLDQVFLMVYVNEVDLGKIKVNQNADIVIDSYKDKKFVGKITYISSKAEFTPKNIQTKEDRTKLVFGIKIELNNPEFILKPGIPADATITLN